MPRSGLHVPLDVNFQDDAKVVQVSPEAELVYVRSLALAKRLDEDGAIHRVHLGRLADKFDEAPDVFAKELVEAGLWMEVRDGWAIAAWASHNTLTDERAQARASEAERKAKWRAQQKMSRGTVPDSDGTVPFCPEMSQECPENVPSDETDNRTSEAVSVPWDKNASEVKCSTSEKEQQLRTRRAILEQVARIIAERQGKPAEAARKNSPERWLASAVRGIADENEQRCYALIVANAQWTPLQLADALEPAKRGPLCGVCGTENPVWCGDDCPLTPPADGGLVDNVTSIKSVPRRAG